MEPITVVETLSPVVARPEASASGRVAGSFGDEVAQLLAAVASSAGLGTKIDLQA